MPPNTTSATQPLDQEIINAVKVQYRKKVLKRLICNMDTASNVADLVKGITFLDAIFWLKEAIKNLNTNVVPNCFRKAGFQLDQTENCSDDDDDDIPLSELRALMAQGDFDDLSVEEFVQLDNVVLTENDGAFNALDNRNSENCDDDEEENEIDDENSEQTEADSKSTVTHGQALDMLKEIKIFAHSKNNAFLFDKIVECINLVQDDLIANKTKQASITDFFTKQNDD